MFTDANLSIKEVFMERSALVLIKLCSAIGDVMEMIDAQPSLPNQPETQRYAHRSLPNVTWK